MTKEWDQANAIFNKWCDDCNGGENSLSWSEVVDVISYALATKEPSLSEKLTEFWEIDNLRAIFGDEDIAALRHGPGEEYELVVEVHRVDKE